MDGINGITFLNALISYVTFYIFNVYIFKFTNSSLLIILIISTLIFGFFNFRLKPKCFAGDVGSITIGFTIVYFLIKLFFVSNNYIVFLLLGVYLLDGGWTIFERIVRKEKVFEPHKRHLYQLFANDLKTPHLKISVYYCILQLVLNVLVMFFLITTKSNNLYKTLFILFLLSIFYFLIKNKVYKNIK